MHHRISASIITFMLFLSTFTILTASADISETYDFTNRIQNKAYYGSDQNQPPGALDIGTELPWQPSIDEYQQIAHSDDVRAPYAGLYSDYHRFKFKLHQTADSIAQIYVEHEGYGNGLSNPIPGLRLFIWNYDTQSWQFFAEHNSGDTDAIVSATIDTEFSKYVDASGYLNLLVQTKENGGSCPFMYTYNSKEYVFVADLYGNGIVDVPHYQIQPEDYIKIGNDQLQPNDGYYQLQIAQEYDEISYLDKVSLITVDHSPQVDVYEPLLEADFGKMYTVSKNLQTPVAAFNEKGMNVLGQISKRDNIYTSGNQYALNLLDLNLGDLSNSEQVKLVLTAHTYWIPGSGSSQVEKPYGKFVQVKDTTGKWKTIYENSEILNPAAMPRTYVLNLTGKFLTNDYSVRIGFYPDVRFDYVGVDTSPEQPLQISTLTPAAADLHYRGYSTIKGYPPTPDYHDYSTEVSEAFSHPRGNFTKYGEVSKLLLDTDDKYAIMHHGDEVSAKFAYTPAKLGLVRDYALYTWGYYKNKHYATGATVEPLPFHTMSSYPYPSTESYPYDQEHVTYINEYNTREYADMQVSVPKEHHTIYTDYVTVRVSEITVGGTISSPNFLELVAPWIAVIAISTVALIATVKRFKTTSVQKPV